MGKRNDENAGALNATEAEEVRDRRQVPLGKLTRSADKLAARLYDSINCGWSDNSALPLATSAGADLLDALANLIEDAAAAIMAIRQAQKKESSV